VVWLLSVEARRLRVGGLRRFCSPGGTRSGRAARRAGRGAGRAAREATRLLQSGDELPPTLRHDPRHRGTPRSRRRRARREWRARRRGAPHRSRSRARTRRRRGDLPDRLDAGGGRGLRNRIRATARRAPAHATDTEPGFSLADALAAKEQPKRELAAIFRGRSPKPRDQLGRYATRGSFDGGAREPLPPPPPTHGEWLGEVLRTRAADRGASF
jgi:hypothetical protein